MEVSHVGTTPLKSLADIALEVDARSTIANDPAVGEARISHSCDSALQEAHGFEAGVHDSNPVNSPPIQMKVPTISGEQHTVITTEQSVSNTVTSVTGGSDIQTAQPSTSQPQQPHLLSQWLQDSESQPPTIDDMLVEQISGLANISQHLLTSDMSNQDYQAIMLTYNEEVEK